MGSQTCILPKKYTTYLYLEKFPRLFQFLTFFKIPNNFSFSLPFCGGEFCSPFSRSFSMWITLVKNTHVSHDIGLKKHLNSSCRKNFRWNFSNFYCSFVCLLIHVSASKLPELATLKHIFHNLGLFWIVLAKMC